MERLKSMKDTLINLVSAQMSNTNQVNTHELGQVIDMIKDLSEAVYYCSIVEGMEKSEDKMRTELNYYTIASDGGDRSSDRPTGTRTYTMPYYPVEGRSGVMRRMYMESKDLQKDPSMQMHELEEYLRELSGEMAEVIDRASPEEKKMLHSKIMTLANKVNV